MVRSLVIIGPSASGKSTLAGGLAARGLVDVTPTWTTRPLRLDEWTGSANHRFVDDAAFDAAESAGWFLGTTTLFGHRYGLPRHGTDRRRAVVARAVAVAMLRRHLDAPLVVQVEAPASRTRAVLAARGTPFAEAAERLRGASDEILVGRCVADHVVVNDGTPDELVHAVATLLDREVERT